MVVRLSLIHISTSSKQFMKSFIQGKSNPECQNITINKESTCDHKMDVIIDEAVDKYSKINDVNTSNGESVKVQLQHSVGSSTMLHLSLIHI